MAKPRFELWGETLRDLGVLVLVFVPLDILVEALKNTNPAGQQNHLSLVIGFAVFGFVLIVVGVEIERR